MRTQRSGFEYFLSGFQLITTKGLKRFVFVPLAVNLILFAVAFYFLLGEISHSIQWVVNWIPDWLGTIKEWIQYFLWPLAVISVLLVFALIFGTLANWIAAPFNGLLAEKVERHLTGESLGSEGLLSVFKDIPRTLNRECAKFAYYLPRAVGFLLLFFILPVGGQVLWFMFCAWMMAIQYLDYPFDNHKISFKQMRQCLNQHRGKSFSFGVISSAFAMVPLVNFLVMPVAICGATAMWVGELRDEQLSR